MFMSLPFPNLSLLPAASSTAGAPLPHPRLSFGRFASQLARTQLHIALAVLTFQGVMTTCLAATVPVRVERTNNAVYVVISPIPVAGALFIYSASDVTSLTNAPVFMVQTNTPFAAEFRVQVPSTGSFSNRGFFRAAHW